MAIAKVLLRLAADCRVQAKHPVASHLQAFARLSLLTEGTIRPRRSESNVPVPVFADQPPPSGIVLQARRPLARIHVQRALRTTRQLQGQRERREDER